VLATLTTYLSLTTFQYLPDFFRELYWAWDLRANPDRVPQVQFLVAGIVMLVPVFIMGGLLPAAIGAAVRERDHIGRRVGGLYASNVVGTVVGSAAAGFVLIPLLGVQETVLMAAGLQGASAVVLALAWTQRGPALALAGTALAAFVSVAWSAPPWNPHLMTSAMYRYSSAHPSGTSVTLEYALDAQEELLYYRDGLTATVTVARNRLSKNKDLTISTNGKRDGSSVYDMPTQRLSAHVPLLVHPTPRKVCVIGMGTGCTAGSAALHDTVDRVTVVEIEAAMVEGSRFFKEYNHAVHDNEKVDIRVTDGRLFLRMNPGAFDVLISEPSNPWLAGTSDLFTVEFFRLGARALREGGLFCQWLQLYGMSSENFATLVRGFSEVFPHAYLVSTIPGTDVLLLGSLTEFAPDAERLSARLNQPEINEDLKGTWLPVSTAAELAARFRMGPEGIRSFVGAGPLHTDDLPIIAFRAPRDLYRDTGPENMQLLARHASGIAPYLTLGGPMDTRRTILEELAAAYRAFLPGGDEAAVADRHAAALDMRTTAQP
jgi:spermidine synthase